MLDRAAATDKLAELALYGTNLQPGQILAVSTYPGKEELTRAIARKAYQRGARWVDVVTFDHLVKRERVAHAPEDSLGEIPPWLRHRLLWLSEERAARVSLSGPQAPDALAGLDPGRAGRDLLPFLPEVGEVVNARTTNWTIIPAPTAPWAQKVYPEAEPEAALDRLWEAIVHICRLEGDPAAAWDARAAELKEGARRLTERRFDAIHLKGPGTDLTVGLFPSSAWAAGGAETVDGLPHHPNLPTEETFTTPDPERVDGHVTATLPLELYGSEIHGLRVEFAGGRVARIDAERGAEALRAAAARDDGASRLGELALVDGAGRIGPLGTVFYDTLIDENAASHVALGHAYARGVEDEADRERINESTVHIDFMIGSPELEVDGLTRDGEVVPLLREGRWQIA
jgi:aminopeptidase